MHKQLKLRRINPEQSPPLFNHTPNNWFNQILISFALSLIELLGRTAVKIKAKLCSHSTAELLMYTYRHIHLFRTSIDNY